MIVFIQIIGIGENATVFDLYSGSNLTIPFATSITKESLLSGLQYTIPNESTFIRIYSLSECNNYRDIDIILYTTTTTTTTTILPDCELNGFIINN